MGEIFDLKTAMEWAKLLRTLEQEQETSAAVQSCDVIALQDQITLLTKQVAALTITRGNRRQANMLYYWCHLTEHLQKQLEDAIPVDN